MKTPGRIPRSLCLTVLTAVECGLGTSGAFAQSGPEVIQRLERQLAELDRKRLVVPEDQPISERLLLDYGGSIRFGFLSSDDQFGTSRTLRQSDGLLYLRAELDGAHRFFGRLRFLYNDFNSGDSFDGRGDEFESPIGDRYWYEFDQRGAHLARTGELPATAFRAKVGRQRVIWGSGLTLNEPLYAAVADLEFDQRLLLKGLAGVTPSSSTIDFDSSRPNYDVDTERAFFGGSLELLGRVHRPYVSALVQRDRNDDVAAAIPAGPLMIPTRFDYDSEYYTAGMHGTLGPQTSYRAEIVHQRGRGLSNSFDPLTGLPVTQTSEDISAWAGLLTIVHLYRDLARSRFELELAGGSGDDDRLHGSNTFGGNASGTNDHAFVSLGYVNTGLALAPDLANLLSLRLGFNRLSLDITRSLRFKIDGFLFAKLERDAPLGFETLQETFVGGEVDLALEWRVASDVDVTLLYGLFIPGDAIPADQDDPRHFLYAGVTYAF